MINIFLFIFCLVNNHIVDGIPATLEQNILQLMEVTTTNYAGLFLDSANSGTAFYGVSSSLSVYNPRVEKDQISTAIMWVRNGPPNDFNFIGVGWHVYPEKYKDDKTHIFVSYTTRKNNIVRGCTNLLCHGFVQTDKSITLGQSFKQTSAIDGTMVEVSLGILQDPKTKGWVISINGKQIGYYPASLFSNMTSANQVAWIGETTNPSNAPSPPMGNGIPPNGHLNHACYFKNLEFVNDLRHGQFLTPLGKTPTTSNSECYNAGLYTDDDIGVFLQIGGPGGDKCKV